MATKLINPAKWLVDLFNVGKNGVKVNADTMLQTAPFWYGINRISGNVGTLPLNTKRDLDPGAENAKDHIAWRLLRKRPNAYQTPFVFKQTETARAICWGNSRSYIHIDGDRSELLPLRPDATLTAMVDGEKWHCTKPNASDRIGSVSQLIDEMKDSPNDTILLPDNDVLHILGFGDGVCGYSLFQIARTSLEVSLGGDKRAAKQMNRGFTGDVILEAPADSQVFRDAKKAEEFVKDFKGKHNADGDGDNIVLLRGGVKANVLPMSNRDAEFIEQRKFQRQEAALWLMLESILGDDTSVSYNSEEQKQLAYLKNCLSNWLVRWEEECAFKLLSNKEFYTGSHFIKFNVASLLRTDMATTMETLGKGITHTIYSPNEARIKLDENPYDGGDVYQNPAITPGQSQQVPDDEPAAALTAEINKLLAIESKQVNTRLNRGDTFESIKTWYAGWEKTLVRAVEKFGGKTSAAKTHCDANLNYLSKNPDSFDLSGSAELLIKEILE